MKYKPSNGVTDANRRGYVSRRLNDMTPLERDEFADFQDQMKRNADAKADSEGKRKPKLSIESYAEVLFALASLLNEPGKLK